MYAYPEEYLADVTENQGKLFDLAARKFPDSDTRDFIVTYMKSRTRKSIDEAQAYVNTMDARELYLYFVSTENYHFRPGKAMEGFTPDWIGEFYAYYQWYYNVPSSEVVEKIPVQSLERSYHGLHDLDLKLAVEKVGALRRDCRQTAREGDGDGKICQSGK